MTMLVGIAPDGPGKAVLHLAGMLARSGGDDLLLCSVIPESWPPGPAKVDAEYQAYLRARRPRCWTGRANDWTRTSRRGW